MFLAVIGGVCPQETAAEGFTGKDFLGWSTESQNSYIQTAVVMATIVISRSNTTTSHCLDKWYGLSQPIADERNSFIRNKIARNSEYHPSAVIMVVLEDACGSFGPN